VFFSFAVVVTETVLSGIKFFFFLFNSYCIDR
jgi:hypothetical protein